MPTKLYSSFEITLAYPTSVVNGCKSLRILLYTVIILLSSCSKDEVETSKGNVQFENKLYNLNYAYLEKIQLNQSIQLRLHLSDKKINFNNREFKVTEPIDSYISFILHNPNPNFDNISDYYPLSTEYENINLDDDIPFIVMSQTTFNIKPSIDPNKDWEFEYRNFDWNDGSLTLDANGEKFEINFSLKKDTLKIKGEFKGKIQEISSN